MGLKSPQMDVVTPARGREVSETCTREKEGLFTGDTLADLDPGGDFALPIGRCPWEAHDVTFVTLDVTQCQDWHYGGSCVIIGTCGIIQGIGRPNVLQMSPNVPPRRLNVILERHDVTSKSNFSV
jgi:hypothetical protein